MGGSSPSQSHQQHQFGAASLLEGVVGWSRAEQGELLLLFRAAKHIRGATLHLHLCLRSVNTLFCFALDDRRALIGHEEIHQAAAWCSPGSPQHLAAAELLQGWRLPQNSPNIIQPPQALLQEANLNLCSCCSCRAQGLYGSLGLGGARSQLFAGN